MIHVIINPAAGQNTPVLATLNAIFRPANIAWDVSITLKAGDARAQARAAVTAGADVVAVYGGDGTVVEAASGLLNSPVPLAILPGGTANVVAQELGIPQNLAAACTLARRRPHVRQIDMGQVNDAYFLLRVGLGTEAKITKGADRELKNQCGFLAYVWSAAQSLTAVEQATYHLTIDGEEINIDGVTCGIINSGNLGLGNLQIAPNIYMDDGLLDVIVIQNANLPALAELIGSVAGLTDGPTASLIPPPLQNALRHWQGKEVIVQTTPPQSIQYDGELLEAEQIRCRVLPRALNVIVPKKVDGIEPSVHAA